MDKLDFSITISVLDKKKTCPATQAGGLWINFLRFKINTPLAFKPFLTIMHIWTINTNY
jgi:hypothetical protein